MNCWSNVQYFMLYKCSQKIIGFSSYSQFYENSLPLTTRGLAGVTPVRGQVDGVNRSVSSHFTHVGSLIKMIFEPIFQAVAMERAVHHDREAAYSSEPCSVHLRLSDQQVNELKGIYARFPLAGIDSIFKFTLTWSPFTYSMHWMFIILILLIHVTTRQQ